MVNEEEFVNKKLWQILQILQKDDQYKNSLGHLTEDDVNDMRIELLKNPDKLRKFLKILKDQNIILKNPSHVKTVSRGALNKVPDLPRDYVELMFNRGYSGEIEKIRFEQMGLINREGKDVNLFVDQSANLLELESTYKPDHSNFITTINRYHNSKEIQEIINHQIAYINEKKSM